MKPNLIGIISSSTDLSRALSMLLMRDLHYEVKSYDDAADAFIARVLGCSVSQLKDERFSSAYLGEQWSYIREERFVDRAEVSRKPVRYFLSPKNINRKFKAGLREIHANFLINALFAEYHPAESKWVIPGIQFANEIDAITERGGIIIHLEKSSLVQPGHLLFDRTTDAGLAAIVSKISSL